MNRTEQNIAFDTLLANIKKVFHSGYSNQIITDTGKDIKSLADRLSEDIILKYLKDNSDYAILTEEAGEIGNINLSDPIWIVDPLDGTVNFTRGIPLFCSSIALWHNGKPIMGLVYDIYHDIKYYGHVEKGLWLNDKKVEGVSNVGDVGQSILTTGFPVNRDFGTESINKFINRIQSFKKIRLLGSAAISLAFVSTGNADAYSEENIMIWDVAAGLALVKAGGGEILYKETNRKYALDVVATNGNLKLSF